MPAKNKPSCAICGGTANKQQKPRKSKVFYRFPKARDLSKKWISVCDFQNMDLSECNDEEYFYKNRYVICSDHFELKWFRNKSLLSKGLLEGAIPTKNLNNKVKDNCSESPIEIEVKVKVEQQLCHGCLSADRRTSPLGASANTLAYLLGQPVTKDTETQFCWECMALLNRVIRFQRQSEYARNMLTLQYPVEYLPLSTLSITQKDYYDYEVQYDDDIDKKNCFNTNNEFYTDLMLIKEETNNTTDFAIDENDTTDFSTPENDTTDFLTAENDTTDFPTANDVTDTSMTLNAWSVDDPINTDSNLDKVNAEYTVKHKKKKAVNVKILYKPYANIIRHSQTDWKKPYIQYYKEIQLDEEDVENFFLVKERKRTPAKMILKCKDCTLKYSRKLDLDRHINLNHQKPDAPYKCLHCKEIQPSMDSLRAHWRCHSVFYQCTLCSDPVFVWRYSLALHLSRTHARVYACTSCKLQYSSLSAFSEHYNKSHPFICDYCNKKCALGTALENHIKRNHTPTKCSICDVTYPNHPLYRKHVTARHPTVSTEPELSYCVECDRQYPNRVLYLKHVNSTHAVKKRVIKSVPCPECGKCFVKNSSMLYHYNFFHVKVTKYHCELCDKYFMKGYGLKIHMQSVHLKVPKPKTKVCDLCGRAFHTKAMLANHRRTHTGERPFKCAYCPAAFAQKGAMKIHQHKQHMHT